MHIKPNIIWDRDHACCFTGHRPQKLPWGFNEEHPNCWRLKHLLCREISFLAESGAVNTFICGMAMGTDLWCAQAVLGLRQSRPELGLRLVAALPFGDQARGWPEEYRALHKRVRASADAEVVISPDYRRGCMQQRNRYMVNNAAYMLAVYGGWPGGTRHTLEYAKKNGLSIIIIDPAQMRARLEGRLL